MVLPRSLRHCETILSAPLYPYLRSIPASHSSHVDRCGVCFINICRPADDVDSRLSTYSSTLGQDRERTMLTCNGPRIFVWSIQRCHRFLCARDSNANRLVYEPDHGKEVASVRCFWLGCYVSDVAYSSMDLTLSRWDRAIKLTTIIVWFP